MKRIGIVALVLVGGMLAQVARVSADTEIPRTIDLRPRWKAGDAFYIEWDLKSKHTRTEDSTMISMIGFAHDIAGLILRVEEVMPDGGARIMLTYDRIASSWLWGNDTESENFWDSDFDPPDSSSEFRKVLQPVIGSTLLLEVDNEGRIIRFDGVAEMRRKVEQAKPDPETFSWFDTFFTTDSKRAAWEDWFGKYAYKPVKRGDTWDRSYTSSHHDNTVITSLDRINIYEDRVLATVHSKGRGTPRTDRESKQVNNNSVWEDGEMKFTSRATYDSKCGWIVSQRGDAVAFCRQTWFDPDSGAERMSDVRSTTICHQTTLTLEQRRQQKQQHAARATDS